MASLCGGGFGWVDTTTPGFPAGGAVGRFKHCGLNMRTCQKIGEHLNIVGFLFLCPVLSLNQPKQGTFTNKTSKSLCAGEPQGPQRFDAHGVPRLRRQRRRLARGERVPQHRRGPQLPVVRVSECFLLSPFGCQGNLL